MNYPIARTFSSCFFLLAGLLAADNWQQRFEIDWLSWADVKAMPYLTDTELSHLTDNDIATGARGAPGPEVGSTLELHFPEAVHVTEIRLVQQGADVLEVTASLNAEGKFETPVARMEFEASDDQASRWITITVNKKVHSVRLIAIDGKPPYRRSYPAYQEIELFTDKKLELPPKPKPESVRDQMTVGEALPLPVFTRRDIALTPCIDLWMAGVVYGREKVEGFSESPGFQRLLEQLRDIDASGVRIFLETYCSRNKVPWKSELAPNVGNEVLKALIDALHQHDLKSYIFLHAWMAPIQKEGERAPMPYCRWDYPYEQSDFIFTKGLEDKYKVRYPCIISDNDFKDKWLGLMSEVVDRGIDGVYVLPDEYYYKGHYLPKTDCANCRAGFKKAFGFDDLPGKAADTAHYRKWKTFEYRRLAEMFNEIAGELKKKKSDLELLCCPNLYAPSNTRMEHGIALDQMGAQPNFTGVQVYAGDPKRAEGAFPDRVLFGSIQTLATSGANDSPIIFYDYLMDLVMNGCTKINMYRLNYMEPYWDSVIKASKMVRLLESWDLLESQSAAETCLLISRASEDWWQVSADTEILDYINSKDSNLLFMDPKDLAVVWSKTKKTFTPDARVRHFQYERFRGMYSTQYFEDIMKKNGVQYNIRYSELPSTLADLSRYKLVVLPFSYSMPTATFDAVKKAVESGTKLLIYEHLAPTDEYGEKYPAPLLQALVGHENVTHVKSDLMRDWSSRTAKAANLKLIRDQLNSRHYFNPNGANVRYWARRIGDDNFLLYLGNMEQDRSAQPVVGLPLPPGNYDVTISSSLDGGGSDVSIRQGVLNRSAIIPAKNLERCGIRLKRGEAKLIRVQRRGK